ncbi:MAG TPA: N-carbamoylputrescine amidase [Aestuariivirgaceae bacterium]|nr:N-carbamoylputrescine amidase [Aestuariivirgaceae bacterium]
MGKVKIGVAQMGCSLDASANCDRAEALVRRAVAAGANVVLLQELFQGPYFCSEEHASHFALAREHHGHPVIARFRDLARELACVIPVSFFERAGNSHFNSAAMIDADGHELGVYRKSHIPDGPGYEEKFYFSPGDTGLRVWETAVGRIGLAICWDQWFPEAARVMALKGAEILLYPTAIGSEPATPGYDSRRHWQNVMRGHAAANIMPLAAANRTGTETNSNGTSVTFYGSSFIADWQGEIVAQAPGDSESVLVHEFDLAAVAELRRSWGVFRDRRPDLYASLLSLDGRTGAPGA